ncbi:MAG: menaquinone biosynthesis protein [Gemmataceae bacterium]|nr:menaquinone biosynthesis protein [Gemmataceae bacterium]
MATNSSPLPQSDHPRIRVGAVNYLNTKPLIYDLARLAPEAEVVLDLPSRLADRLAAGELDVALIPVVEYLRAGVYRHVPDIAIATRGPVLSVTLFSRVPWSEIRSIALDEGSRTSVALTQVISRFRYEVMPRLEPFAIDADPDQVTTDAVLLIGDRAMHACLPGFGHAYDLGEEWTQWTGLPFVFAVWAVRPGVELGAVEQALHEAKQLGLRNAGPIAAVEAPCLKLGAGFCRRYLETILSYDLGERELAGLRHFAGLAAAIGLVPREACAHDLGRCDLVESR